MTIDERMEALDQALNDYEQVNGLPSIQGQNDDTELSEYLSMPRSQMTAMSAQDCFEIAYRLAQYAVFVTRLYNKEQARITWAEAAILETSAPQLSSYDKWMKHEVKLELIARSDEAVRKLVSICRYAQQRVHRLNFISSGIKHMSETLINMGRAKRDEEKTN